MAYLVSKRMYVVHINLNLLLLKIISSYNNLSEQLRMLSILLELVFIRDLLEKSLTECKISPYSSYGPSMGSTLELLFSSCGTSKLFFMGKADGEEDFHSLGNITVDLPHFAKLIQTNSGQTWAKIAFSKENNTCYPNRTYTVKCGSLIFNNVREDSDVLVYNLFPGSSYTCSFKRNDFRMESHNASLQSGSSPYFGELTLPFIAHDNTISMRHDEGTDLLLSPNFTVIITVTDSDTNETKTAHGLDVLSPGISGLKPARQYEACIKLDQVMGTCTYDCRNETKCFKITTLPYLSPHWKSLTGVWIVCSLLFLFMVLLLIMFIMLWMRLEAIGAPSSKLAWIQLKRRTHEYAGTREESTVMNIEPEDLSEI